MNKVTEGLVLAIHSLPKADKARAIGDLWKDSDCQEAMVDLVIKGLLQSQGNGRVKYYPSYDDSTQVTARARGKLLRENYVAALKKEDKPIEQVDGVWARTAGGLWVAIPFATERRDNFWFLGLPENDLLERIHGGGVAVVLLCQSKSGSTLDFVIPPDYIQEIVGSLSKSKGQLKFNLRKDDGRYLLVIPGRSPQDVSHFLGKVSTFES